MTWYRLRTASFVVVAVTVLVITLTMTVLAQAEESTLGAAQSPATGIGAPPAASSEPAAIPFPWPTLEPPSKVPVGKRFQPDGPPDATKTRHGVRVELWLSSPTVAPGEWVQALVRTTNLRDTPVWSWSGECRSSGTHVGVDLGDIIPPGKTQDGNAAVFKEQALLWQDVSSFTPWRSLDSLASTGSGLMLVECPVMPGPLKLKAGASKDERFAWYPTQSFDGDVWFQPPYPGPVEVTVSWPFLSRGERPKTLPRRAQRSVKSIKASAELEITGDGPGTPSLPELIDIALVDPEFRTWVEEQPSREKFCDWCVSATGWSGLTYGRHLWLKDVPSAPPTGVLTVELTQGDTRGIVSMDPWTGEILDVRFL